MEKESYDLITMIEFHPQHGVPYEKILEVINLIYLSQANDLHSHTAATIEKWEKEITKNITIIYSSIDPFMPLPFR